MAWPMPPSGQWNPNMGMNAMMPDMSAMGSYTQEQWAAMQQQNWQQWAQWQQQYAQWHNQYGEKYAEQIQSMQTMSAMPPLPPVNSAPPPAPPPPEKPPPPPPHENNQPLYGQQKNQPNPVPAPQNHSLNNSQRNYSNTMSTPSNTASQGNFNNVMLTSGNNGNQGNYTNTIPTTNSNQNWSSPEASIEKPQPSVNTDALNKLAEEERLFDIQFEKWEKEIDKWRQDNVNHPDKQAYNKYEQKFESCRAQLMERRQQMKQKRARLLSNALPAPNAAISGNITTPVPPPQQNININRHNKPNLQTQNYSNTSSQDYKGHSMSQFQQYKQGNKSDYSRNSNKNVDPQDRYESYHNIENKYENDAYKRDTYENNDYSDNSNSNFLPTSASSKGIPGLDLVPETDKVLAVKNHDVIDITDDSSFNRQAPLAPDYTKISKGINNILGDEKIMNILSMVRVNNANNQIPGNNQISGNNQVSNTPSSLYPTSGNNIPSYNQSERNQNNYNNQEQYNNTMGNRQNLNMPFNRQANNFPLLQNRGGPPAKFPPQGNMYNEHPDNMQHEPFHDNNSQYGEMPMQDNRQMQSGPSAIRPNIPPLMGPIQDIAVQQNMNESSRCLIERRPMHNNLPVNQDQRPKWVEEPLFTPSIIVEYEHKALRLKARDFIEPVHMFDYNHISKDGEVKKKDFEKEVDEMFSRKPRRFEKDDEHTNVPRYSRDQHTRDFERRMPRVDARDEFRSREESRDEYRAAIPPRDDYDDRRRPSDRYDDRRRDDRDKYSRREDSYRERDRDRDKDRESYRDRNRDYRRDDVRNRSRSRDRDSRKRGHSKDCEIISSGSTKKSKDAVVKQSSPAETPKHVIMIDDILEPPGREMRPEKLVIILRGLPGSGKSYLAKLIRDKEAEHGGTARIMSIDDYFMQEGEIEEKDPTTGKVIKKPTLKYEYDENLEETYINSLKRAFKRTLTDGYFSFLIYDAVNDQLKSYADVWNFARQNGFQVYICTLELDAQACYKRNIHNRKLEDIQVLCTRFFPTPAHHIQLDPTTLLQSAAITDVHMEDVDDDVIIEEDAQPEVESVFTSKWEKMDDAAQLARLDGINKPLRPSQLSMEDYLQIDEWKPNAAKPGKKSVRWADIEESRQQEKMRAIGFVVGQTDWNRMTDPTMGSSALTQTKYIERVRRN